VFYRQLGLEKKYYNVGSSRLDHLWSSCIEGKNNENGRQQLLRSFIAFL